MPSPAWTSSIARTISAGGVSFSRKPAAPACSARRTSSSASKVVSTRTAGGSGCAASRRVAAMPSSCGMRMSMRTTSGRWQVDRAEHLAAVGGLGHHLEARRAGEHRSAGRSARARRRRRAGRGSSRQPGAQDERAVGVDAVLELAAGERDALGEPDEAGARAGQRRRPRRRPPARGCGPRPAGRRRARATVSVTAAPGACLRALVRPSCAIR